MEIGVERRKAAKMVAHALTLHGLHNVTVRSVLDCYDNEKSAWHGFFVAGTERTVRAGTQRRWSTAKIQSRLLEIIGESVDHWQLFDPAD
jgi:hypothetical protein